MHQHYTRALAVAFVACLCCIFPIAASLRTSAPGIGFLRTDWTAAPRATTQRNSNDVPDKGVLPVIVQTPNPTLSFEVYGSLPLSSTQFTFELSEVETTDAIRKTTVQAAALKKTFGTMFVSEFATSLEDLFGASAIRQHTTYTWRVVMQDSGVVSEPSTFQTAFFYEDGNPNFAPSTWVERKSAENIFRASFLAPAKITTAVLYSSGVGAFEAFINGLRSNDHVLDPGTTDFAAFSLVSMDDITGHVVPGVKNTLSFMLGNGWYGMPQAYDKTPKLRFVLMVNGAVAAYSAENTTRMNSGPITYDNIYNGETYNCNKEISNWMSPSFNDASWAFAVRSAATFNPAMVVRDFPAIRIKRDLAPVNISHPAPGIQVVDFGREVSGVCEIVVEGQSTISLHHGEMMDHYDKGMSQYVYFRNLRSAMATDTYTSCTNISHATYRPRFTYHGFRFVQINSTGTMSLKSIHAKAFFTHVKQTSTLASSHPVIRTLHQHILWGQTANLMSYPSDCDQRDERLGWMADGWLSSDESVSNFDMHTFYRNWVKIIISDQVLGMVGDVSPFVRYGSRPADPTWGLALPYVANLVWREYGDTGVLSKFYNASLAWVNYLVTREAAEGMKKLYAYYGDWVPPPPAAKASNSFVSAFSLVYATQLVLDMATALNSPDVPKLQKQLDSFLTSFNAAWFNPTSKTYDIGVQTTFALPMALLGLVPFDAALGLLTEVEGAKFHLDTGIVGLRFLFDALSSIGHSDAALEIILQETYPGFAFEWNNKLETHATTLWELWDAPLEGPGMNSRNHIMDGSVDAWLHRHVGGVRQTPKSTAFRDIEIKPDVAVFFSPVQSATVTRVVPRGGRIVSEWSRQGGVLCEKAAAGRAIELDCGNDGGVIDAIDFVSIGQPSGLCAGYKADHASHANASLLALLQEQCQGKRKCVLGSWWTLPEAAALELQRQQAYDAAEDKHVISSHIVAAVRATCTAAPSYTQRVVIPPHTTASIHTPRFAISRPTLRMSRVSVGTTITGVEDTPDFVVTHLRTSGAEEEIHFRVVGDWARLAPIQTSFDTMTTLVGLHYTDTTPLRNAALVKRNCWTTATSSSSVACIDAISKASNAFGWFVDTAATKIVPE